jgi:alpha-beta hydrolase superfamily lysophospholipase
MKKNEHYYKREDHILYAVVYEPDTDPIATIQIIHGLGEHCGRYNYLIEALVLSGYQVITSDHVLHGRSVTDNEIIGSWSFSDDWNDILSDLLNVYQRYGNHSVPYFVIGHSMGSVIAREYAYQNYELISKLILMGSLPTVSKFTTVPAVFLSFMVSLIKRHHPSPFLKQVIDGKTRDEFDNPNEWLSKDKKVIKALNEDPYVGYVYSARFYHQFFKAIHRVNRSSYLRSLTQLPILFLSGKEDPTGDYGNGVLKLVQKIRKISSDSSQIDVKIYDGMRHELHNEIKRDTVFKDIIKWLVT